MSTRPNRRSQAELRLATASRSTKAALPKAEQLARESTFSRALDQMPQEYIMCRDIAHDLHVQHDYHIVDATRDEDVNPRMGHAIYVERRIGCRRCSFWVSQAFSISSRSNGIGLQLINSVPHYPDGYQISGTGGMAGKRDMVRAESFRRLLGDEALESFQRKA